MARIPSSRRLGRAAQGLLVVLATCLLVAGPGRVSAQTEDWWAEGQRFEARGLVEEAADCYVKAITAAPAATDDEGQGARALARLFHRRPPSWLHPKAPQVLPLEIERIECELPPGPEPRPADSRCARGEFFWTTSVLFPDEGRKADPLHGWRVNRVQYGYALDPAAGRWELRFLLLFPSSLLSPAGADHTPLAAEVRRGLSYLYWLAKCNLGREAQFDSSQIAALWLCEQGRGGGETFGNNIYLYQVLTPRPPGEWWRELAHEYGHLVLPGVGGFPAPDPWANGDLGELLFTRWLLATPMAKSHPWTRDLDAGEFEQTQVQPRRDLFRREGPASSLGRGGSESAAPGATGGQAMLDYFLGAALEAEESLGRNGLAEVFRRLDRLPGARVSDFLRTVEEVRAGN